MQCFLKRLQDFREMIYSRSSIPLVVKSHISRKFFYGEVNLRNWDDLLIVNKVQSSRKLFLQWILQWRWHLRQILYPIINVEEKRNVDNTGNRHRIQCVIKLQKRKKEGKQRPLSMIFTLMHYNCKEKQFDI